MKRTNATLWSIASLLLAMAVIAGPATARPILADPPSTQSNGVPVDVQSHGQTTSSVNAITGGEQPTSPQATTVVKASDGFDWDAALVGALGALGLVSISLVTVRTVRRHGRFAVGSRA